jgi:hypothetical protein
VEPVIAKCFFLINHNFHLLLIKFPFKKNSKIYSVACLEVATLSFHSVICLAVEWVVVEWVVEAVELKGVLKTWSIL